ncbi:MAG: GGDEF domain-containing protein [Aquabacterium sp.]|nr:MAG: GGDEF domain-containing protein [Aquabacterium sp.]
MSSIPADSPALATPGGSDLLFGRDVQQRLRIRRWMLSALVYLGVALARWVGVAFGVVKPEAAAVLTLYDLIGVAAFYGCLRTGYSEGLRDPSMTLSQILFALSSVTVSYALIEATRGAALQLLCLILVFGMFRLSPAQILACGLLACGMLGTTVVVMWQVHPEHFDLRREVLNFALAAVLMPTLAFVAQQVSVLRRRQIKQGRELAQVLEQLQDLATHDALTGLINRRHMLDALTEELKRQGRTGHVFCLAMLDIDHFKRINDGWGHQAGDTVLSGFAADATSTLRKSDQLARWGGEEFLLLMPETRLAEAEIGLGRIRERFNAHDWQGTLTPGERVTVSMGVAEFVPGEPLERTLARADEALYCAKTSGRDRIVCAAPESPTAGQG